MSTQLLNDPYYKEKIGQKSVISHPYRVLLLLCFGFKAYEKQVLNEVRVPSLRLCLSSVL